MKSYTVWPDLSVAVPFSDMLGTEYIISCILLRPIFGSLCCLLPCSIMRPYLLCLKPWLTFETSVVLKLHRLNIERPARDDWGDKHALLSLSPKFTQNSYELSI